MIDDCFTSDELTFLLPHHLDQEIRHVFVLLKQALKHLTLFIGRKLTSNKNLKTNK